MKKALLYALTLALALSLTACGQPKAEQPTDPAPSTSAPETAPEQTPAAPVETEDTQPPEETEPQEAEQVQLFTEVNETVYATGTVNLRSGPSTAHDKVGSLNKSDSVTRVGIGTADAEGWSRIQLSDGSLVYVSNKYLSTTKPVVQQQQTSKPSSGQQSKPSGGQQSKPSESTQQQQTQQTETQPSTERPSIRQQLEALESQGYTRANVDGTDYSDAEKEALGKLLNGG